MDYDGQAAHADNFLGNDSLGDDDIDRVMKAFRGALASMDASPQEAARIRDLANAADAQIAAEAAPETMQDSKAPARAEPTQAAKTTGLRGRSGGGGLLGRILRSFYSRSSPKNDTAGQGSADQGSPVSLTLSFRHSKLRLEIGPSARPDDPMRTPDTVEMIPVSSDHAHGKSAWRKSAEASFWDALDPTEREALRSVAYLRTFAAGATIMQEGERADHVIVILGGRVRICINENGRECVLAERGLGQMVGERGALQISVRSATVIAVEMVWALVVQTKDFAAFISAHPRVLALVQDQRSSPAIEQSGRHRADNYDPAIPGPNDKNAVTGQLVDDLAAQHPQYWQPLNGENCTIVLTDVVAFGARTRTDRDRLIIREALSRMTNAAIRGIPDVWLEDRGDGILIVIPPHVSTAKAMDQLLQEMPRELDQHNSSQRDPAKFQLRFAVNVGPVVSDAMGVSGEAIIVTARLVEAPAFKEALARSTASLGVIASPFVYETVIRHGTDPREVASYSPVPVEVKESTTTAWMRLINLTTYTQPDIRDPHLARVRLRHQRRRARSGAAVEGGAADRVGEDLDGSTGGRAGCRD